MSTLTGMDLEADIQKALSGTSFALYGAGQLGKMTLDMWPPDRPGPKFLVDAHKKGSHFGLPVLGLEDARPPNVTYLLSAFKLPPSTVSVIFEKLGQPLLLTVYDYFNAVMPHAFGNGWRNLSPDNSTGERLSRVRSTYADDLSRRVFDCAVAWRYRRELRNDYPVAPEEDKYDLSLLGRGDIVYDLVIDGGSYDLHSLAMLQDGGARWKDAIAIDADPARARICREEAGPQITVLETALSDFDGEADFLANGLLSARLASPHLEDGRMLVKVPVARLDSLLAEYQDLSGKKILMKLHVEGAELAALKGAESLLRESRCDILLNLSHDEQSFLELPVYLESFGCFEIFLRSHALFGEGLTLFARHKDNR